LEKLIEIVEGKNSNFEIRTLALNVILNKYIGDEAPFDKLNYIVARAAMDISRNNI